MKSQSHSYKILKDYIITDIRICTMLKCFWSLILFIGYHRKRWLSTFIQFTNITLNIIVTFIVWSICIEDPREGFGISAGPQFFSVNIA